MAAEQKVSAAKIIDAFPMDEIKEALLNEYRRRIIRYKMVDEAMKKKYGMTFSDFESLNIVKERPHLHLREMSHVDQRMV